MWLGSRPLPPPEDDDLLSYLLRLGPEYDQEVGSKEGRENLFSFPATHAQPVWKLPLRYNSASNYLRTHSRIYQLCTIRFLSISFLELQVKIENSVVKMKGTG